MCETNYEIIKTRNIFLSNGDVSDEIVLTDTTGNMYFTFRLNYVTEGGFTQIDIKDEFHAEITIETKPNALTKLDKPHYIGTYEGHKDLFFNFVVQPRNADGAHNVTITFYTK